MAGDRKLNYPVTPQGGLQTWAEKNQQNMVETNHLLGFCVRSLLGTTGDKRQASEGAWGSVTPSPSLLVLRRDNRVYSLQR